MIKKSLLGMLKSGQSQLRNFWLEKKEQFSLKAKVFIPCVPATFWNSSELHYFNAFRFVLFIV
jgi:hypothetical protein